MQSAIIPTSQTPPPSLIWRGRVQLTSFSYSDSAVDAASISHSSRGRDQQQQDSMCGRRRVLSCRAISPCAFLWSHSKRITRASGPTFPCRTILADRQGAVSVGVATSAQHPRVPWKVLRRSVQLRGCSQTALMGFGPIKLSTESRRWIRMCQGSSYYHTPVNQQSPDMHVNVEN